MSKGCFARVRNEKGSCACSQQWGRRVEDGRWKVYCTSLTFPPVSICLWGLTYRAESFADLPGHSCQAEEMKTSGCSKRQPQCTRKLLMARVGGLTRCCDLSDPFSCSTAGEPTTSKDRYPHVREKRSAIFSPIPSPQPWEPEAHGAKSIKQYAADRTVRSAPWKYWDLSIAFIHCPP